MLKPLKQALSSDFWKEGGISFYFACIIMVLLPVYYRYIPPFMVAWVVVFFFELKRKTKELPLIPISHRLLYILLLLFYLWQLAGMLYTDNQHEGWRNIEVRLSLLMFPLVLILPGRRIFLNVSILLKVFAFSTLVFIIFCYGYALFRSISIESGSFIFNPHPPVDDWLSYFYSFEFAVFQHPSYLAMYVLLSGFISFEFFFNKSLERTVRIFWLIVGLVMLLTIYFLSSRAGILATLISILVYTLFRFRIYGINWKAGVFILLAVIISIPVFLTNPKVNYYLNKESKKEWFERASKESRLTMWKAASHIISRNPVIGVGTGDIQDELTKEYMKTSMKESLRGLNFNAHNQYIEVLAENGLVGFVLFLSTLGIMFYISYNERNIIYMVFIIIILISFMFETMLNRLAGVSFFTLFSFLLLHTKPALINSSDQKSKE